jgi:hypothetical protein
MLYTAYYAAASYHNYSSSNGGGKKKAPPAPSEADGVEPALSSINDTIAHAETVSFAATAVSAVALSLARLVRDFRPEYLVLALDSGRSTFRHEAFKEYKAGRSKVQ